MTKGNNTRGPKLTVGDFKGNPVDVRKPAKAQGSQSAVGPRKQVTKND